MELKEKKKNKMKFVLELNKSEADAIKRANVKVKQVFKKVKDSFQIRVIDDKNKSKLSKKK